MLDSFTPYPADCIEAPSLASYAGSSVGCRGPLTKGTTCAWLYRWEQSTEMVEIKCKFCDNPAIGRYRFDKGFHFRDTYESFKIREVVLCAHHKRKVRPSGGFSVELIERLGPALNPDIAQDPEHGCDRHWEWEPYCDACEEKKMDDWAWERHGKSYKQWSADYWHEQAEYGRLKDEREREELMAWKEARDASRQGRAPRCPTCGQEIHNDDG